MWQKVERSMSSPMTQIWCAIRCSMCVRFVWMIFRHVMNQQSLKYKTSIVCMLECSWRNKAIILPCWIWPAGAILVVAWQLVPVHRKRHYSVGQTYSVHFTSLLHTQSNMELSPHIINILLTGTMVVSILLTLSTSGKVNKRAMPCWRSQSAFRLSRWLVWTVQIWPITVWLQTIMSNLTRIRYAPFSE